MSILWHFLKLLFFWSKKHSFLNPEYHKKRSFLTWFAQKTQMRKSSIIGQKLWANLFGNWWFFGTFSNFSFLVLKAFFFLSRISRKYLFWLDLIKNINEKKVSFLVISHRLTHLKESNFLALFKNSLFWQCLSSLMIIWFHRLCTITERIGVTLSSSPFIK